jgi:hypothetical protein
MCACAHANTHTHTHTHTHTYTHILDQFAYRKRQGLGDVFSPDFFLKIFVFISVCTMHTLGGGVFHMCASDCRSQKKVSEFLELELKAVVSHLLWVVGTKHRSSARTLTTVISEPSLQPWVFSWWDIYYNINTTLNVSCFPSLHPASLLLNFKKSVIGNNTIITPTPSLFLLGKNISK